MKNIILKNLTLLVFVFVATGVFAQVPPPPPSGHGAGGNQPAGGSGSLTGGIGLLIALGAAYGGKKLYVFMKEKDQLEE